MTATSPSRVSGRVVATVKPFSSPMAPSEKGFYAMSFLLSLFGAVAVQKNIRDLAPFKDEAAAADAREAG